MRWDNPNNCCQSLRLLAEAVRAGDVTCHQLTGNGESVTIRLETKTKRKR